MQLEARDLGVSILPCRKELAEQVLECDQADDACYAGTDHVDCTQAPTADPPQDTATCRSLDDARDARLDPRALQQALRDQLQTESP